MFCEGKQSGQELATYIMGTHNKASVGKVRAFVFKYDYFAQSSLLFLIFGYPG